MLTLDGGVVTLGGVGGFSDGIGVGGFAGGEGGLEDLQGDAGIAVGGDAECTGGVLGVTSIVGCIGA